MEDLGKQLNDAAKMGNIERVGALLDQGVAVDSRDDIQWTPFIMACYHGKREVATLLLDRGANVNAKDKFSNTPAIMASLCGHLDILQILVSRGADIHHRNQRGYSCLLYNALYGRLPVCEYLISLGADLMAANYCKQTALTDYGFYHLRIRLSSETKAMYCATLQKAWENGPHPSQVKRRRDEYWARRGPFLMVLAEHGYRPPQARPLEIALAALSVDPIEAVVISTKPQEVVLRDEGLVRYIVEFM